MKIELNSIGFVRNSVNDKKDIGWGDDVSRIVIDRIYEQGLIGLNEFSHILVVYYLDKAKFDINKHLVRRPQGRDDMPIVGILSQRAKDRPNPIGVTAVKIIKVEKNVITVKGLDAVDNTPVLDIKPYYPAFDRQEQATVPDWVNILMKDYF